MYYPSTLPATDRYFRPRSVDEAVTLLRQHRDDARILSGGTDLVTLMRNHVLTPRCAIDVTQIAGLRFLECDSASGLRAGALTTLREVETSRTIGALYPALQDAARHMGSPTMRHQATIIGNLCRASPAADTAGPLLVLDASIVAIGPAGTRTILVDGLFAGPGRTILQPDELVVELQVPPPAAGSSSAFLKLMRVAEDLAKLSVSVSLAIQDGVCTHARIALGAVAPTPLRAKAAEVLLTGSPLTDELIDTAADSAVACTNPITDLRSTRDYRLTTTRVLVQRAVRVAAARARAATAGESRHD